MKNKKANIFFENKLADLIFVVLCVVLIVLLLVKIYLTYSGESELRKAKESASLILDSAERLSSGQHVETFLLGPNGWIAVFYDSESEKGIVMPKKCNGKDCLCICPPEAKANPEECDSRGFCKESERKIKIKSFNSFNYPAEIEEQLALDAPYISEYLVINMAGGASDTLQEYRIQRKDDGVVEVSHADSYWLGAFLEQTYGLDDYEGRYKGKKAVEIIKENFGVEKIYSQDAIQQVLEYLSKLAYNKASRITDWSIKLSYSDGRYAGLNYALYLPEKQPDIRNRVVVDYVYLKTNEGNEVVITLAVGYSYIKSKYNGYSLPDEYEE